MAPPAGRRSDVAAVELHPRMCRVIHGVRGQTDDKLRPIALFAKELEEDERADETAWLAIPDAKRTSNGVAQ